MREQGRYWVGEGVCVFACELVCLPCTAFSLDMYGDQTGRVTRCRKRGADDDGRRKRRGATGRVEIEEEGNLFIARGCLCGTDSK